MIRVAMIMGKMMGGGVEAVVMNYFRNIDRSKFQFDFIIDVDSTIVPENEILLLGGNIYRISPYQHLKQFMNDLEKIFLKNNYQIVHSHINALNIFPLKIAKKCNVPIRIAHNHSTNAPGEFKKNFLKRILKVFSNIYPTHYMSPTKYAGQWLFGRKIADTNLFILKNAIDIEKFKFNPSIREELRQSLGYTDDDIVIGNIGRCVWQKNQVFLLHLLKMMSENNKNIRLLIIGNGPLEKKLNDLTINLHINDKVDFLPNTSEISNYYQAMDCFVFPSNYEGLGIVAIEAQVSGLPTLVSTRVPQEVNVTNLCDSLNLSERMGIWSELVLSKTNNNIRRSFNKEIQDAGYEISIEVKRLEKYYISALTEERKKCFEFKK